jgi:hypothetical protein
MDTFCAVLYLRECRIFGILLGTIQPLKSLRCILAIVSGDAEEEPYLWAAKRLQPISFQASNVRYETNGNNR